MTIQEYTERTGDALQRNHPRNYPAYRDSPIACWRYVCRCYGAGLAPYTDKEIQSVISTLYGRWFIALDMSSQRPNIDNKEFIGWIRDACQEARRASSKQSTAPSSFPKNDRIGRKSQGLMDLR